MLKAMSSYVLLLSSFLVQHFVGTATGIAPSSCPTASPRSRELQGTQPSFSEGKWITQPLEWRRFSNLGAVGFSFEHE